MLQTLREKTTGWVAVLIVGALAIPFAFFGIENYSSSRVADYVAKVGESEIGRDEFTRRFESYVNQSQQMMGESFRRDLVDTPEARRLVLDRMIDEELFRQAAAELGMVVPAEVLREEIRSIPALQVAGEFSPEVYRQVLAGQRLSAAGFEQMMLKDIQGAQLPRAVVGSAFASPEYVDSYLRLRDQKRSFRFVELPAIELANEPEEEALKAHYESNPDRYRSQEQVVLEYVELDPSTIEVDAEPSDEVLQERYAQAGRRFVEPEQRLASHILFRVPANSDAETERAALEKAEAALAAARAEGADFAAIAREQSEDPGSKNTGGDLGWLERGFTDAAFEEALFAMEAGTLSEPVKSAEGWHVIQLREVRPEVAKPFDEVREELRAEYVTSERERIASERAGLLVDLLLKDPTSLEATAGELGLELKRTGPITRNGGADPLAANPLVREAAFSVPVLEDGLVSDMIELENGRRVALRSVEHQKAELRPFEEVREQVLAEVRAKQQAEQADDAAAARLAALKDGSSSLQAIAEELGVEVQTAEAVARNAFNVNPVVVAEAFKLGRPASEEQALFASAALAGSARALIALDKVEDGDPAVVPQVERDALRSQIGGAIGEAEVRALAAALRQRTEIVLAEQRL
jgi:peptidyl-prolyl cis-trans isomerase D